MTLEELKAALDAAIAALEADKENAELKANVEAAQAAYDAKVSETSGDPDESKLDEKTKAYLAKLRKENASHRTKNKDVMSKLTAEQERTKAILKAAGLLDEEKPEEKLKASEAERNNYAFRNAVLESALQHGIPADGLKYYQFLISEAAEQLQENEEISDERLVEIVSEVKKGFGSGARKPANSTVTLDKDGNPVKQPDPSATGGITLEKFLGMGIVEKSKLYTTHQALYEEFTKQAKEKRKLI